MEYIEKLINQKDINNLEKELSVIQRIRSDLIWMLYKWWIKPTQNERKQIEEFEEKSSLIRSVLHELKEWDADDNNKNINQ